MNYKKNKTDYKKGKEILNKSRTKKDNDTSNSFIKNCHIFEYKSLSFKSEEEQNDIQDKEKKRNDIIDNSLVSKTKINHNKKVYDNKYFQDLADKLYNNDEHLNKKKKIQRKNISLHNIIKLNEALFPNSNRNIKTLISKKERPKKKKKRSLFPYKINKKEEDGFSIKKFRASLPSNNHLGENKSKHKGSNFGTFLKLKAKNKYPAKETFLESFFRNSVYSREYSIKKKHIKGRVPSVRSIKTNKKNNNIFNSEKNTKVEEKKEIPILDKSNLSHKNIKNHTERDANYEQKKKINKQKNKWKVVNFCCCLSSGCL
jgi:hypothetical protein